MPSRKARNSEVFDENILFSPSTVVPRAPLEGVNEDERSASEGTPQTISTSPPSSSHILNSNSAYDDDNYLLPDSTNQSPVYEELIACCDNPQKHEQDSTSEQLFYCNAPQNTLNDADTAANIGKQERTTDATTKLSKSDESDTPENGNNDKDDSSMGDIAGYYNNKCELKTIDGENNTNIEDNKKTIKMDCSEGSSPKENVFYKYVPL